VKHEVGASFYLGIRGIPDIGAEEALVGILAVDEVEDLAGEVFIDLAHLVNCQRKREARLRP